MVSAAIAASFLAVAKKKGSSRPEAILRPRLGRLALTVIHLIRASMKYVSWKDRKKVAAAMRPIYTALNEAAAKTALDNLRRQCR
jgi:transposase-like protein